MAALGLVACDLRPAPDATPPTDAARQDAAPRDAGSREAAAAAGALDDAALIAFVTAPVEGAPRYTRWGLFPGSSVCEPLGLPVHGRFTTVRVNAVARAAALRWLEPATLDQFVEFPVGSIIVKGNTMRGLDVDPTCAPGVLTIMYKAAPGTPCQTDDFWREGACYGGGWRFVFYEVPGGPLAERSHNVDVSKGQVVRDFCVTCHASGADADYVRSLQRMRRALPPGVRAGTPVGVAPPADRDPFCEAVALSAELPGDVALDPASISTGDPAADRRRRQRLFDCVSWRTFVALNWPVSAARGEPQRAAPFWDPALDGYAGGDPARPLADYHPRARVWETYKEVYELFQTGVARSNWDPQTQRPPVTWDREPPNPVGPGCDQVTGKVLMMAHKNRAPLPGQGVLNESGQAFAGQFGLLTDQNGRLVRYDVRLNRSEFEFVLGRGYARTANVRPGGPAAVLGTRLTLPDNRDPAYGAWGGAMELKGSWRELCTDADCAVRDNPSRYFAQSAWIYEADPNGGGGGRCRPALMGLVGLHVAHKTHWAPQWIWSTFEHVDLVPPTPGAPGVTKTALFNPVCPLPAGAPPCDQTPFLVTHPCCPNVPFNKVKYGATTPNQVTRLQAIEAGTSDLNQVFAGALAGTPFENYVLIGTQWPSPGRVPGDPSRVYTRPCNGDALAEPRVGDCYTIVPQFLRNTSMESFMASDYRPSQPLHQFSNRGCMNCHGEAGADFSYLWLDAVNQRVTSAE